MLHKTFAAFLFGIIFAILGSILGGLQGWVLQGCVIFSGVTPGIGAFVWSSVSFLYGFHLCLEHQPIKREENK